MDISGDQNDKCSCGEYSLKGKINKHTYNNSVEMSDAMKKYRAEGNRPRYAVEDGNQLPKIVIKGFSDDLIFKWRPIRSEGARHVAIWGKSLTGNS